MYTLSQLKGFKDIFTAKELKDAWSFLESLRNEAKSSIEKLQKATNYRVYAYRKWKDSKWQYIANPNEENENLQYFIKRYTSDIQEVVNEISGKAAFRIKVFFTRCSDELKKLNEILRILKNSLPKIKKMINVNKYGSKVLDTMKSSKEFSTSADGEINTLMRYIIEKKAYLLKSIKNCRKFRDIKNPDLLLLYERFCIENSVSKKISIYELDALKNYKLDPDSYGGKKNFLKIYNGCLLSLTKMIEKEAKKRGLDKPKAYKSSDIVNDELIAGAKETFTSFPDSSMGEELVRRGRDTTYGGNFVTMRNATVKGNPYGTIQKEQFYRVLSAAQFGEVISENKAVINWIKEEPIKSRMKVWRYLKFSHLILMLKNGGYKEIASKSPDKIKEFIEELEKEQKIKEFIEELNNQQKVIIKDAAFLGTSTKKGLPLCTRFGEVELELSLNPGKYGRDISYLSGYGESQCEFLLIPNQKFRVTKATYYNRGKIEIQAEHIS